VKRARPQKGRAFHFQSSFRKAITRVYKTFRAASFSSNRALKVFDLAAGRQLGQVKEWSIKNDYAISLGEVRRRKAQKRPPFRAAFYISIHCRYLSPGRSANKKARLCKRASPGKKFLVQGETLLSP